MPMDFYGNANAFTYQVNATITNNTGADITIENEARTYNRIIPNGQAVAVNCHINTIRHNATLYYPQQNHGAAPGNVTATFVPGGGGAAHIHLA